MTTRIKAIIPKRGEVYLVNFDPTIGSEIKKTRHALIVQNDIANQYSSVTIVAALTSQYGEQLYPTEVLIQHPEGGLEHDSVVLLSQIRTIDKTRLIKRMGVVNQETIKRADRALEISLGLFEM